MRIAMFHPTLPKPGRKPGGVEVFVDRLANALASRSHDVEVLTYSPKPSEALYQVKRIRPRVSEDRRLLRQYGSAWLLNFRSFKDVDVAHFHGDDWFFLRRNVPVVRTFHGSALLEAMNATSLRRRLDKAIIFSLELLAARLATSSYGVGLDSEIIYQTDGLLNLGIDIPPETDRRSTNPSILFIGTWSGRKRGSLLFEIFCNEIRPALPNAELWMVSDACEAAAGVHWLKDPTDGELGDIFPQAWTFCLPSSYEGFGIPYLEAMAYGVPVVATPNPGSRLLLDRRCGVLAPDETLGERLIELLLSEKLRQLLAKAGRERAKDYSWEKMVERHESAYLEAINRWDQLKRRA